MIIIRKNMSLREITKDLHTEAEKTNFAKLLLTGKISTELYTNYLYQMIAAYGPVEFGCKVLGYFDNLPGVERLPGIYQDFIELRDPNTHYTFLPATLAYNNYVLGLLNEPSTKHLIKAHLYVRHMGDLYGGQYIAKTVPGSGKFYQFDDVEGLRNAIREELTDDLGDEARVAFKWAIKIMKELHE
jgi:heme oxygenase